MAHQLPPTVHHSLATPPHPGNRSNGSSRHGIAPSQSSTSLAFPHSVTMQNLGASHGLQGRSSRTWTASSGDLGSLSDTDKLEDRAVFVMEYNRLAKKVMSRPFFCTVGSCKASLLTRGSMA